MEHLGTDRSNPLLSSKKSLRNTKTPSERRRGGSEKHSHTMGSRNPLMTHPLYILMEYLPSLVFCRKDGMDTSPSFSLLTRDIQLPCYSSNRTFTL